MADKSIENEFITSILDNKITVEEVIRTNFNANWLTYNGEIWDWLLNYWQINDKLPTIELVETRYPTYQYKEIENPPTEILDALRKNSQLDRFYESMTKTSTLITKTGDVDRARNFLSAELEQYDDNLEQDVFDLASDADSDALYQLYKKRYDLMQQQGFVGIPTGFGTEFDAWLNGGSIGGNLYGMLAPLGVGKTWSMQILGASAMKHGKIPFMLVLEGNLEKEGYRALTAGTGVSNSALHTARFTDEDVRKTITFFKEKVRKTSGHFYLAIHGNRSVYTPSILRQKLVKYKPDLLIVDYLSLMGLNASDTSTDEWKIINVMSRELKKFSVAFNIPVWAVLQGNRGSNDKEELTATDSSFYNPLRDFDVVVGLTKVKNMQYIIRLNGVKGRDNKDEFRANYRSDWDNGRVEFVDYIIEDDHF